MSSHAADPHPSSHRRAAQASEMGLEVPEVVQGRALKDKLEAQLAAK